MAHDLGPGTMQVALVGNLDIGTALHADRALRATQARADLVVLDLRAVNSIGITAARVAMVADARARRVGGRLVVLAKGAPAPRLFSLARLHRRLEVVEHFPGARLVGEPA